MYRSFTDRVLGGVFGGLGASWRINPWLLRTLMVIFTVATLGTGALLYPALWWAMPQESLLQDHRANGFSILLVLVALVIFIGGWVVQLTGSLEASNGQSLYLALALVALSGIFLLRQLGGRQA
ncbi:MAG: PspC domain-containing protein [bacterium]|nr:PspC domain-containing protein [bacterium]